MSNSHKFHKLMEPGQIGKVHTKNRIIKNGTHLFYQNKTDCFMNQRQIDFYDVLARGGVGLIVVPSAPLIPETLGYRIDEEEYIAGFSELAETIHKHNCPAFVQMFHTGPMTPPFYTGPQPASSSAIPKSESPRPQYAESRELTIAEIHGIVEKFARTAVNIQKAGFDGIELNAATTHLLNSFLSRAWNRRQDSYGIASLENRARIVVEIIQEVKSRNGQDFTIMVIINGAEVGLKNGITLEESKGFAQILEEAGADAIHVRVEYYKYAEDDRRRESTHFPELYFFPEPPKSTGENIDRSRHGAGASLPLAAAIKKVVSVPVITVGRLDHELGEWAIQRGMVDFISLNRRLLVDPELPNKIYSGNLQDIAPCTGCNTCFDFGEHNQPVHCQVNTSLGREREYVIKPAVHKKRVMVIGAGPAGMEAARVAALRGHTVMLYERERKLGGSLPIAAMVKGFEREDILGLIRYLKTQMTKLGVKTILGREVSRSLINEIKPDVLIVATGGIHHVPELPGINRHNVLTSQILHRKLKTYLRFLSPRVLRWLTRFYLPVGKRVVIMGGGVQGCQTAEFLVKRGRKVTIVDTAEQIGDELLEILVKPFLLNWLEEKGVTMMPGVKYEEITGEGLVITTKEGKRQILKADTIVTAMPLLPNTEFLNGLDGIVPEFYTIGDCREPHLIIDAIADGSRVARAI